MKRLLLPLSWILLAAQATPAQHVSALTVQGPITPATAQYIHRGIETASSEGSAAVLIRLNTPGGLLAATRAIVSDILGSTVPVIVYVSPAGSQAGSAGVFITLAANVAAMAPGTNIGAAHPVGMQGAMDSLMSEKVTNDAAAFIRSIAGKRNRNLVWAEDAVRRSVALTEQEALNQGVIDLVAASDRDVLLRVDGRAVETASGSVIIRTGSAIVREVDPSWSESLLGILSDPNIAYILFLIGLYGLLFELYNPGAILPGVAGGISIILAFYALQALPVNAAGVALIVFAIILFLLEIKIVSHGLLGIGGTISLLLGSAMLIRPSSPLELAEISWSIILFAAALTAFFFLFVIGIGLRAQRKPPASGAEGLVGMTGTARTRIAPDGTVRVHGELWAAHTTGPAIAKGDPVRIVRLDNLTLTVEPVRPSEGHTP